MRNAYNVLIGKPEGKRVLGRSGRISEGNIKMYLSVIGFQIVDWIYMAKGRDRSRCFVYTVMHLRVLQKVWNFLSSLAYFYLLGNECAPWSNLISESGCGSNPDLEIRSRIFAFQEATKQFSLQVLRPLLRTLIIYCDTSTLISCGRLVRGIQLNINPVFSLKQEYAGWIQFVCEKTDTFFP
jgi:hypothetical protein